MKKGRKRKGGAEKEMRALIPTAHTTRQRYVCRAQSGTLSSDLETHGQLPSHLDDRGGEHSSHTKRNSQHRPCDRFTGIGSS